MVVVYENINGKRREPSKEVIDFAINHILQGKSLDQLIIIINEMEKTLADLIWLLREDLKKYFKEQFGVELCVQIIE